MQQLHEEGPWEYGALTDTVLKSDEALVLSDAQGVVLLANSAASDVVGIPAEAMVGHSVEDFGREAMHAFQKVAVTAVIDNHVEITVREAKLLHSSGSSSTVDLTLSPTLTDRGPVVTIGIREANDKYRQTKLFRGLLEAAPDGMVIVNSDGVIVLVNAQVEKVFGYARAELVGEPVEILVPDRFSGMHMAFRNGYVSEPRTRPMGLAGDLFARRKDGSEFPVEVSSRAAGDRRGAAGVGRRARHLRTPQDAGGDRPGEGRVLRDRLPRAAHPAHVDDRLRRADDRPRGAQPPGPALPLGDHAQRRA